MPALRDYFLSENACMCVSLSLRLYKLNSCDIDPVEQVCVSKFNEAIPSIGMALVLMKHVVMETDMWYNYITVVSLHYTITYTVPGF